MVKIVGPEVVTVDGLKDAAAPDGTPVTVNPTVPVKPFRGAIVTVKVADAGGVTVLGDVDEIVKSAGG